MNKTNLFIYTFQVHVIVSFYLELLAEFIDAVCKDFDAVSDVPHLLIANEAYLDNVALGAC